MEKAPWGTGSQGFALMGAKEGGSMAWAGEAHGRTHFRKKKDPITDWANVLFRS